MMGHIRRPGLSAAQKEDLWQRWNQGESEGIRGISQLRFLDALELAAS